MLFLAFAQTVNIYHYISVVLCCFEKQNEKHRNIKKRMALLENGAIDYQKQRLFFGGKLLRDRTAIYETRLQRNFVVQVILQDQPMPPNGAITTTSHLTTNNDHRNYSTPVELPIEQT